MTVQEIQQICITACKKYNIEFNLTVTINGRLTRTLGRVISHCNDAGKWAPTAFELSRQLVETGTTESIVETVLHECAHYIAIATTGENHGHDAYFKNICHTIGTSNDKTHYAAEYTKPAEERYKYAIYCKTCEDFRGGYNRMCKTLQNLNACYCKKCGKYTLTYIQNW